MTDALAHLYKQGWPPLCLRVEVNEHPSVCETQKGVHRFRHAPQARTRSISKRPPDTRQASRFASGCASAAEDGFIIWEELFRSFSHKRSGSQLKQLRIVTVNDLLSALFIPRVTSVRVPFLGWRGSRRDARQKVNDNHAPMPTSQCNRN